MSVTYVALPAERYPTVGEYSLLLEAQFEKLEEHRMRRKKSPGSVSSDIVSPLLHPNNITSTQSAN